MCGRVGKQGGEAPILCRSCEGAALALLRHSYFIHGFCGRPWKGGSHITLLTSPCQSIASLGGCPRAPMADNSSQRMAHACMLQCMLSGSQRPPLSTWQAAPRTGPPGIHRGDPHLAGSLVANLAQAAVGDLALRHACTIRHLEAGSAAGALGSAASNAGSAVTGRAGSGACAV